MGEGFVEFYQTRIKKSWKLAFVSAFVIGLLVHMYKFTNTLLGHDSLFNIYGTQNVVRSGRWFLAAACSLSSFFDLPWVNGVLSLIWIGVAAAVVIDIFRIENPVLILLTGGLLVTFPAVTQTFYFEYTADGYMLAMVLAALTVRFSMIGERRKSRLFLSFCCITLTCGIYQAYVSFALVLSLGYFMTELLENRYEKKLYTLWIRNQILIYGLGMAAYYVIWQIAMVCQGNLQPNQYMGIDTIGQIGPGFLWDAVKQTMTSFVSVFMVWNFLRRGLTMYTVLNILFLMAAAYIVVTAVRKSRLYTRKGQMLLFLLCMAAIPFAVFIWFFASQGIQYVVRMEQSVCLLYILCGVLANRWLKPGKSDIAALLLAVIIFNNGVTANMMYQYMHRCYEESYATGVEIATHIHLLDDGTQKEIVIVGLTSWFSEEEYESGGGLKELALLKSIYNNLFSAGSCPALFLSEVVGLELSYYRVNPEMEVPPVDVGSNNWPVSGGWTWRFPLADEAVKAKLIDTKQVADMPVWPAADSIQVIDDLIVIKLGNVE
ncbi:MAG: hypothetical protein HFI89_02935 [Lachnospiraceae bacterium]|nr:hypothetical protein [Lachnospiraceae bacterium]